MSPAEGPEERDADTPVASTRRRLRDMRFLRAYLAGPEGVRGNAAQAAKAAGFQAASPEALAVQGSRMLSRPTNRRAIRKYLDVHEVTIARIMEETASIAFSDIRDVVDWDGEGVKVVSSRLLDEMTAATIQEVEQHETEHGKRVRVKLHGKLKALELLARFTRAVGADAPTSFTLVIGRAARVVVNAPDNGQPEHVNDEADAG